jgi:XTP/dITP diphosphohydrolase/tetrapyrrole methylase family protein/MazG family protein
LIRRHPHVFGTGKLETSEQVLHQWDIIKAGEKKNGPVSTGVFKEMPPQLPALMHAEAVWKQIEKKKLPVGGVVDRARIAQLAAGLTDQTLGRLLFELAAAARANDLDSEGALRRETLRVKTETEKRHGAGGAPAQ